MMIISPIARVHMSHILFSLLHLAIEHKQSELITKITEVIQEFQLVDLVNIQNGCGESCLHVCCVHNKPELIDELLRLGADPNNVDNRGDTPLHVAVQEQNEKCVQALLNGAANIPTKLNVSNDLGLTPLHVAVKGGNLQIIKQLQANASQSKQAIYEVVELKTGSNALHMAIEQGHVSVVRHILENAHADVNQLNSAGHSPLYLARVLKGRDEIIQMLIHKKALDVADDEEEEDSEPIPTRSEQDVLKDTASVVAEKVTPVERQPLNTNPKFDEICLTELSSIFNKSDKWKAVAASLGYQLHVSNWQTKMNPSKVMFMFSEVRVEFLSIPLRIFKISRFLLLQVLRVSKGDLIKIFTELNEVAAVQSVTALQARSV